MKEKNCGYLTPFKLCIIDNFPFIEADFDAITNYQLLCKVVEYLNKVIVNENEQNKAIKEIQDFLNTLDLQDEVDKKLDEMAESGELQEIIADYLNAKAVFGFDTVASMKSATNLINGSYAETLGYYAKNDGGSALYKIRTITNDDVVNEMDIIELADDTLVAELIIKDNTINMKQVGCSSEVADNSTIINTMISKYCNEYLGNKDIYFPADTYPITHAIEIEKGHFTFNGGLATIRQDADNTPIIEFTYPSSPLYTAKVTLKDITLEFANQQTESNGYGIKFDHMVYQSTFENITIIKPYIGIGTVSNIDQSLWKMSWKQILINSFYYRGFSLIANTGAPQNYFENIYLQCAGVTQVGGCCFYANNLQAVIDNIEVNTNSNGAQFMHLSLSSVKLGIFCSEGLTVATNRLLDIVQSTLSVDTIIVSDYTGEFSDSNALIDNYKSSIDINWIKITKRAGAVNNLHIVRNSDSGAESNHITKIGRIGTSGNQQVSDYVLAGGNGKGLVEVGKEPMANYNELNANTKIYGDIFIKKLTGNVELSFDNTTVGIGEYNIIVNDFNSNTLTIKVPHYNGAYIVTTVTVSEASLTTLKFVFTGRPYNLGWILYKNGTYLQSSNL